MSERAVMLGFDGARERQVRTDKLGQLLIAERTARFVRFNLSLDTSAYSDGDTLAETQEVPDVFLEANGKTMLVSLLLNDKDDQGVALDLVFLRSNVSLGTENSAPSITDGNADEIIGIINIASSAWIDLGGCRVATGTPSSAYVTGLPLLLTSEPSDSRSVFVAAITRGAPTYTAAGITVKMGLIDY
jgi:hypothetical protein